MGGTDDFLNHLLRKAGKALSDFFYALNNQLTSPETRIRIGKSLVLSRLQYGADIVPLSRDMANKFDAVQNKMLRIIFGVPRATSSDALLMLAGETPFSDRRCIYGDLNRERFKKARDSTMPLLLEGSNAFRNASATAAHFDACSSFLKEAARQSTIPASTLNKARATMRLFPEEKHVEAYKTLLVKLLAQNAHKNALRALTTPNDSSEDSCQALTWCFHQFKHSPLLKCKGYQFSHYVQWLTNSIRVREDFVLRRRHSCALCQEDIGSDARKHLIGECNLTTEISSDVFFMVFYFLV